MKLSRRQSLVSLASLGLIARFGPARAAKPFAPDPGLVAAANKEGTLVLYTASLTEVVQETINVFNKSFPQISVNMVRASGGQLITRIRSEAAVGKLEADVIDHSDRGQSKSIESLFADYAPPNAADYMPETLVSPKLWPTITPSWCIAWNPEVMDNPPKTWMDLCKPDYAGGKIGQVIGPSGGTTWTRIMFERQVLGEDYWAKQAATKPKLYPSSAPLCDAVIRGEVSVGPILMSIVFSQKKDGAPIDMVYPPEGVPITPYGSGIAASTKHPNAARLWMDWALSDDGQIASIRDQGNVTSMKNPPIPIPMYNAKVDKLWTPKFSDFVTLHDTWLADWGKAYGYRQ
jgi:iron(III) transport system substrate-binding protein